MGKAAVRLVYVIFWVSFAGCLDVTFAFKDCVGVDSTLACYGARVMRNVMKRLTSEKSLKLMPGVEIVPVERSDEEQDRTVNEIGEEREGVLDRIGGYLASHELKINLGNMAQKGEIQNVVRSTLLTVQRELTENFEEARKKDKGGLGMIMMMGVMMSKMMGALGIGSVAMLAMKALGVSMMALLLSSIIGLKKLSESGDQKGRQSQVDVRIASDEPNGYQFGYDESADVMRRRRRRRRSPKMSPENWAYRGWTEMVQ
ncbi:uncharacterized protein LOC131694870 [Topomyia yanbarensis]|uniref:uncharacterized protein LOC131694870 n=1 Tax=Topomyia yanbarensis TaxID=2498891 RepID=UPI00273AE34E|nr:uncharacterized protein LOC131694870 [Topomyia yanbarensis]